MIRLIGEKLKQWDVDRSVEVILRPDRTLETVRFWKASAADPLAVAFSEVGGAYTAPIPNVLLKGAGTLTAEIIAYDADGNFETEKQNFVVRKSEKPEDYDCGEGALVLAKPDWNQNNPSAPDYVKNRPFYEETVETVALEEQTITIKALGASVQTGVFAEFADGENIRVVWDGTAYDVVMNGTFAGNETLQYSNTERHESGLPFCMVSAPAVGIQFFAASVGEHTVSVIHYPTICHTIDSKYLPSTGGGAMIVTVTTDGSTYTPDKTYAEIKAAVDGGQIVRLFSVSDNAYYDLTFMSGVMVKFTSVLLSVGNMVYTEWQMYSYDTAAYKTTKTLTTS